MMTVEFEREREGKWFCALWCGGAGGWWWEEGGGGVGVGEVGGTAMSACPQTDVNGPLFS